MNNILTKIVATKKEEVKKLYQQYDIEKLKKEIQKSPISFYQKLAEKAQKNEKFLLTEFKRKSPSEGWINKDVAINQQVNKYQNLGTNAISVLTDYSYFGGTYKDLNEVSNCIENTSICVLNKEFIIDEIQVYLARKNGANIILLIAAILETTQFNHLKTLAENLGMGVIAEIHNAEEWEVIKDLNCKVIGINNRNLNNFKTALNNCNFLAQLINSESFIIAESGMKSNLDLQIAGAYSHGFLIGTSLMRNEIDLAAVNQKNYFFKACGLKTAQEINNVEANLIGINFSPVSKRKINLSELENGIIPSNAVAVFYNNSVTEIESILTKFSFKYVQLYAEDVPLSFIQQLKQKVILAIRVKTKESLKKINQYAPFIDLFILDAAQPGKGKSIQVEIPRNFPYPFLLAGGINETNLNKAQNYTNCLGVDIASGIETNGQVDLEKITNINKKINGLSFVMKDYER